MAWTPQYSRFDKMQSLRIELLYALQRRGNKALGPWATAAPDLTQDWHILKMLVELMPQRVELRIWCGSLDRISDRTRQEVPNWPSSQNPMSIRQNTYCIPDNIRKPNGLSSLSQLNISVTPISFSFDIPQNWFQGKWTGPPYIFIHGFRQIFP
jgi:hypothetical protein